MLHTDNAAAACSAATFLHDSRVAQFWDPDRLTGLACARDFQAPQAAAALDSLADEHRPFVERWIADPSTQPVWDAAYFYPPGVEWHDHVPPPAAWTKQLGFWGSGENPAVAPGDTARVAETLGGAAPATGRFWTNRRPGGLLDSDWIREFASGVEQVAGRQPRR